MSATDLVAVILAVVALVAVAALAVVCARLARLTRAKWPAYCLQHPRWRLNLQTHKFLGIR